MAERIPNQVMDVLIDLDKARADGDPWVVLDGWHPDTMRYLATHKLAEANTVDGEPTEHCITPAGQAALISGELPKGVDNSEPLGLPVAEGLSFSTSRLLKVLADYGNWMPTKMLPKDIGYPTRQIAQKEGYVIARGNTAQREYLVSEKGLMALGWAQDAVLKWMSRLPAPKQVPVSPEEQTQHIASVKARFELKKQSAEPPVDAAAEENKVEHIDHDELVAQTSSVDTVIETMPEDVSHAIVQQMNNFADRVHPAPLPPMPQTIIDIQHANDCADGCEQCVYRDVVALLERRVPGVREVVAGLKLIDQRS